MNHKNLKDHLAAFYGEQMPRQETASRMKALAQIDAVQPNLSDPRSAPASLSIWLRGYAAAATLALCVLGFYLLRADVASDRSRSDEARPNLVAVGVFADWCGRCPMIEPLFAELADKYSNQPILFISLDITDEKKQRRARQAARSLGIEWIYDRKLESGMIKILDRERHTVLATLVESQEMPQLVSALDQALPGES